MQKRLVPTSALGFGNWGVAGAIHKDREHCDEFDFGWAGCKVSVRHEREEVQKMVV